MLKKKSLIFILVTILGFPQITLAGSLIKTDTLVNNNIGSIEIDEDNSLLTQRRGKRRRKKNRRRQRARRARRYVPRRGRRKQRRRARRRSFRNEVRRHRRRQNVRDIVGGIVTIGIGAAIIDSLNRDRRNAEVVIINQGNALDNSPYYNELYKCRHLDQGGGYYNRNELEDCLDKL